MVEKGIFFLIVECQLINVIEMIELESQLGSHNTMREERLVDTNNIEWKFDEETEYLYTFKVPPQKTFS